MDIKKEPDDVDHSKLRELTNAATPGPWKVSQFSGWVHVDHKDESYAVACFETNSGGMRNYQYNADFIAAANPATVLALLDDIDALKASAAARQAQEPCATPTMRQYQVRVSADIWRDCQKPEYDQTETRLRRIMYLEGAEPRTVAVPELADGATQYRPGSTYCDGWNACIAEVLRMNGSALKLATSTRALNLIRACRATYIRRTEIIKVWAEALSHQLMPIGPINKDKK